MVVASQEDQKVEDGGTTPFILVDNCDTSYSSPSISNGKNGKEVRIVSGGNSPHKGEESKNGVHHQNGNSSKGEKAPKLYSLRMSLALLFMFATWTFMFQRLSINFGLICMVRSPSIPNDLHNETLQLLRRSLNNNDSSSITTSGDYLSESQSEEEDDEEDYDDDQEEEGDSFTVITTDTKCPSLNAVVRRVHANGSAIVVGEEGEFEWSKDVQGLILASFYYGFVVAQIPGGWFSDRYGAKSGLVLGGAGLSVLTILLPFAARLGPSYLVASRVLAGILNGASMPAISILASRWFPDTERGFMLGIAYSGFGFATAVAYPISAFFCKTTGWPALFYFAGGVGLVWAALSHFFIHEWPETHPKVSTLELGFIQAHRAVTYGGPSSGRRQKVRVPWGRMLTSLPVWALMVCNFTTFWLFLTMSMYLPTYLKEVLHLDISKNGLFSAVPFTVMMLFHFLVAIAFDKIRKRRPCSLTNLRKIFNTLGVAVSSLCLSVIFLLACDNVVGVILLVTVSQTFLEFTFMGGYLFSIFDIAPRLAGPLTAVMNTVGLSVGLLAPAIVSWLTPKGTREEWILVFLITAGINAFGGLFYLLFGSAETQKWAANSNEALKSAEKNGGGNHANNYLNNGNNCENCGDKEMKALQIRLIGGESNINGEIVSTK